MDAKMSEAEQWMRQQIDEAFRIPENEWGCESAPEVVLDPRGARALINELDRLRECIATVDRIRENWSGTNEALDLELRGAIARATGGEGTGFRRFQGTRRRKIASASER